MTNIEKYEDNTHNMIESLESKIQSIKENKRNLIEVIIDTKPCNYNNEFEMNIKIRMTLE